MATLNSTQDSDRLIRELMVKNKNLQSRVDALSGDEQQRAAAVNKLREQLAAHNKENRSLTANLEAITAERNEAVRSLAATLPCPSIPMPPPHTHVCTLA